MKKINIKNLDKKNINIEKLEGYTPQGICVIDNYLLISAYDHTKIHKSAIFILKNEKLIGKTTIYNNSHVGGITFDRKNNIIWLTDKLGTISGYKKENVFSFQEKIEPVYKKINVSEKLENHHHYPVASFITSDKNYIYVGNYTHNKKAIIKKHFIKKDGNIDTNAQNIYKSIKYAQGITIKRIKSHLYLFISTSVSRYLSSKIHVYEFDNYILKKKIMTIKVPPMLEQITTKKNNLIMLFEGNSIQYKRNYSDIIIIDLNKIF